MSEVIRQYRTERGMSQRDLAGGAGVDVRQIRRYEAGEQQPLLSVAVAIADALGISVAELAGKPSHRIKLSGMWWASWQTFRSGSEKIASQQVEIKQEGDRMQVATITRGLPVEEGGYHWNGEPAAVGQRTSDGLVCGQRGLDPVQGHHVLRAAPARAEHVRPVGRPGL